VISVEAGKSRTKTHNERSLGKMPSLDSVE
jgi:hypothetical protein